MGATSMLKNRIFNFTITSEENKNYYWELNWKLALFQTLGLGLAMVYNMANMDKKIAAMAIVLILISLAVNIYIPKVTKGDIFFVLIINMLYTIGLITIMRINPATGYRHMIWYILSMIIGFIVYFILKKTSNFFRDKYIFFFLLTLATFIVTLVFGDRQAGAVNWIRISEGITIQLSEFAKISYIFLIASFYSNYEDIEKKKYGSYYLMIASYIYIGFFFLQGELGTAMIFFALMIGSMFVFEERYLLVVINVILAFIGLLLAYYLFNHIRIRFEIWLNPWDSYNDKGYQIIQSLFAIASGGFFGSGIGLGRPDIVPVSTSDFIYASVVEEMGIFMGIFVILLFILLVYKSFKLALMDEDIFYSSLAFSIGMVFAAQSIIMFGGVLKIIPLTGITTPFMSYGGSSLLSSFMLFAILQLISSRDRL